MELVRGGSEVAGACLTRLRSEWAEVDERRVEVRVARRWVNDWTESWSGSIFV